MSTEFGHHTDSPVKAVRSPWLTIWTKPRRTVRAFLDSENPRRNMIWLAWAAGFLSSLNRASSQNTGDHMSVPAIVLLSIVTGIIAGLFTLYAGSYLLKITGRWLGGSGSTEDLQTALARGLCMPAILTGVLWLPELLLLGNEMFTTETPLLESPIILLIYTILLLLEVVLAVWSAIITLKAIGEAHRFSAWKALFSILLPVFILLVLFSVIMLMVH